ncbi:MAG: prepilin-type N-terminal cleavage/methylation domain-containing protein [Magnetococcales bacterium]|nr:prepilin-type N-terminal cleavage/methylation domain-containing protein [Magnetococcales bacterium]
MNERGSGFTLIEAMVALVILSTGLLALGRFQGSVTQTSAQAKARTEALQLAQGIIESRRSFASLVAVNAYSNGTDMVAGSNAVFTRSWVWGDSASPAYRSLAVTVTWQDQSGNQVVGLNSRLSKVEPSEAGGVLLLLAQSGT